jgi:predicted transcriptional regulator
MLKVDLKEVDNILSKLDSDMSINKEKLSIINQKIADKNLLSTKKNKKKYIFLMDTKENAKPFCVLEKIKGTKNNFANLDQVIQYL